MTRTRVGAAMLALGVLAACGGGSTPGAYPTPNPLWSSGPCPTTGGFARTAQPLASTGSIEIVKPGIGDVVKGSSVTAQVDVTGACLLKKAQNTIRPDTGHVHLFLDDKVITLLAGVEFTIEDVPPGPHLLKAEFTAADHASFTPQVVDTVTFRAVAK